MSLASVFSITAALVILGFFLILTFNIQMMTENVESDLEVKVFLTQTCTEEAKAGVQQALENNEYVKDIVFEDKDTALKNFSNQLSSYKDLLTSFNSEDNPMPESFIVHAYKTEDLVKIKDFANEIKANSPGVIEYVKYGENYVTALSSFNHFANILSVSVTIVLSVIALLLIYNTIKLTVFARRKEIGIMKYVGATNAYIRGPFILEGMFLGIIAAIVSLLALRTGYFYILGFMSGNSMISITANLATPGQVLGRLSVFFVIYGVAVGTLGSVFAIRKFLDV